jgi:hypothetical protein
MSRLFTGILLAPPQLLLSSQQPQPHVAGLKAMRLGYRAVERNLADPGSGGQITAEVWQHYHYNPYLSL